MCGGGDHQWIDCVVCSAPHTTNTYTGGIVQHHTSPTLTQVVLFSTTHHQHSHRWYCSAPHTATLHQHSHRWYCSAPHTATLHQYSHRWYCSAHSVPLSTPPTLRCYCAAKFSCSCSAHSVPLSTLHKYSQTCCCTTECSCSFLSRLRVWKLLLSAF